MTPIWSSNQAVIASDNRLSIAPCQAIILNNDDLMSSEQTLMKYRT